MRVSGCGVVVPRSVEVWLAQRRIAESCGEEKSKWQDRRREELKKQRCKIRNEGGNKGRARRIG
jgi:hypothetical protein